MLGECFSLIDDLNGLKSRVKNLEHIFLSVLFFPVVLKAEVAKFSVRFCCPLKYWEVFPKKLQSDVEKFCSVGFLPVKVYGGGGGGLEGWIRMD